MQLEVKESAGAKFIKVGEELNNGDTITIKNAGKTMNGKFGLQTVFLVSKGKGERALTFNQTSINNLIAVWGGETETWIGKEVRVRVVEQMIEGKLRKIAYLMHPDWDLTENGFRQVKGERLSPPPSSEGAQGESKEDGNQTKDEMDPDEIPF